MWPFRRRPHRHNWSPWSSQWVGIERITHRACRCAAIQRYNTTTGEVTIWLPDGVDSGLLDRGLTRQVFEDL